MTHQKITPITFAFFQTVSCPIRFMVSAQPLVWLHNRLIPNQSAPCALPIKQVLLNIVKRTLHLLYIVPVQSMSKQRKVCPQQHVHAVLLGI